jgi:hypothetical protein
MPQNVQQHHPSLSSASAIKIMEWIPVVFVVFKGLVLATGMFFAIKWHYDQGKKGKETERRAVLRASGQVVAIFVLVLLALGLGTFGLVRLLGLDFSLP